MWKTPMYKILIMPFIFPLNFTLDLCVFCWRRDMNQIRPSTPLFYAPEAAIGDLILFSVLKVIWSFSQWIGSFMWKMISYRGPRQIPVWKEPAISWVMLLHLGWSALISSVVLIPSVDGKEYWLWKSVVFVGFSASSEIKPVVLCMAL